MTTGNPNLMAATNHKLYSHHSYPVYQINNTLNNNISRILQFNSTFTTTTDPKVASKSLLNDYDIDDNSGSSSSFNSIINQDNNNNNTKNTEFSISDKILDFIRSIFDNTTSDYDATTESSDHDNDFMVDLDGSSSSIFNSNIKIISPNNSNSDDHTFSINNKNNIAVDQISSNLKNKMPTLPPSSVGVIPPGFSNSNHHQHHHHNNDQGVVDGYSSTLNPIERLFKKMEQPPYSTRSNPDILIFDVDNTSLESQSQSPSSSSPSSISSFITSMPNNMTNIFNNDGDVDGKLSPYLPPLFHPNIPHHQHNTTSTTSSSITTASSVITKIMNNNNEIIIDPFDDNGNNNNAFYFGSTCFHSPEDYELITSMLCSSLVVLGVVYFTYGYRCFRALAFFIGMVFGAALFHTVCTAENINIVPSLVPHGNLIASLLTGLIVGLFTMLVAYIGLFVIGIHLGLLLAIGFLFVIYILKPYYLMLQAPLSALTLLIFFVALSLVGALTNVYFSKGCTILASSMYGSALTLLCADYFLEDFKVIHWFLDQLSNGNDWYGLLNSIKRGQTLCFGSYVILILWPIFTMIGIIVQSCCTAKNYEFDQNGGGYGIVDTDSIGPPSITHHHQPYSRDNLRNLHHHNSSLTNSHNSRSSLHGNSEEARLEQRHRKYRYLYQVRTAHGDVISQHYLQSLQQNGNSNHHNNKKQQLCLPDQDSFTFNSDLSSHFLPSESRTTTLSVA